MITSKFKPAHSRLSARIAIGLVVAAVLMTLLGCPPPTDPTPDSTLGTGEVPSFFWGSWVRMDGVNEEWYFSDTDVEIDSSTETVSKVSDTEVVVSADNSTVTRRSDNMIVVEPEGSLEYYMFRRAGATGSMAAGVRGGSASASINGRSVLSGLAGIRAIVRNANNETNEVTATSGSDGTMEFDSIIPGDEYTLEIPQQDGVDEEISVQVRPEFDGENIGFVTLTDADQNFKVSYQVSGGDQWGYLYAGNTYDLTVRITNIGSQDMLSADYQVIPPSDLTIAGDSVQDILGTVQAGGGVKELSYSITAAAFTEDVKELPIPISITSVDGQNRWDDQITLRIFRDTMSLHVRSESNEVQGIVISPDNRSFPFRTTGLSGSITIPAREEGYVLALSGADYDSETKYALKVGQAPAGNGAVLTTATINEPNNDESQGTAAYLDGEYLGYLGVYDLDFYSIFNRASTDAPTDDGGSGGTDDTYTVSYDDNSADSGTVPTDGNTYQAGDLVTVLGNTGGLTRSGLTFGGWNTQANGGGTTYQAGNVFAMGNGNVTLYALWSSGAGTTDPSGDLVATFDSDGLVTHHSAAGGNNRDYGRGVAVDENGNVVVAGSSASSGGTYPGDERTVWRYTSSGTLDSSFGGGDGIAIVADGSTQSQLNSLLLHSSGRIVTGGSIGGGGGAVLNVFTESGALDTGFSSDGDWRRSISGQSIWDIAEAGNGDIVFSGFDGRPGNQKILVGRFGINGTPDSAFGTDGILELNDLGGGAGPEYGYSVEVDASGRILVGGAVHNGSDLDMFVARLLEDGSLDTSFGGDGTVIRDGDGVSGSGAQVVWDLEIGPDGSIYAIGGAGPDTASFQGAIWKLNADGSLNTTFGNGGFYSAAPGSKLLLRDGELDTAGYLIVAGEISSADSTTGLDVYVTRVSSTSADTDVNFGTSGEVFLDGNGYTDVVFDVAIADSGVAYLTGIARTTSSQDTEDLAIWALDYSAGAFNVIPGTGGSGTSFSADLDNWVTIDRSSSGTYSTDQFTTSSNVVAVGTAAIGTYGLTNYSLSNRGIRWLYSNAAFDYDGFSRMRMERESDNDGSYAQYILQGNFFSDANDRSTRVGGFRTGDGSSNDAMTTSHSFSGSTVIYNGTRYFTEIELTSSNQYTAGTATGGYPGEAGSNVIQTWTRTFTPLTGNPGGRISIRYGDMYHSGNGVVVYNASVE